MLKREYLPGEIDRGAITQQRIKGHTVTYHNSWIPGSIVNGHQLGFGYTYTTCECGESSWGGSKKSNEAWVRRHIDRVLRESLAWKQ